MSVKAVFFDLDGTLLPMDETKFTKFYFSELAKEVKSFGIELMPLSVSIWKGVKAMVKNDGTMTNYECFWISFFEDFRSCSPARRKSSLRSVISMRRASPIRRSPPARIRWL